MTTLEITASNKGQLAQLLVEGVETLYINEVELTALPPLPASLKALVLGENKVSVLPPLPAGLTMLGCQGNFISVLPPLPSTLKTLVCRFNKLTALPPLPANLEILDCGHNPLTALPELPPKLRTLKCNYTKIVVLPKFANNTIVEADHNPELTTVTIPFGRQMKIDEDASVVFEACPKLNPKPFPGESMLDFEERISAPPEVEIRIPAGQTDVISMAEIEDGTRMVDFQDERSKHRYYTEQTYNSLNPKKNPFTRAPIDPYTVVKYVAKLDTTLPVQTAGRRRKTRKMSKKYCKKTTCRRMGFSQKASCRPYKNCYK